MARLSMLLVLLLFGLVGAETLSLEQADGLRLYYYLDVPAAPQPAPLVVILQGSECLRVEHKYGPMIEQLNQAGVGVLRIDGGWVREADIAAGYLPRLNVPASITTDRLPARAA